jgi:hypothetical protein
MGHVRLSHGATVTATASEADGRAGDAGPQAGPREPSGWLAAVRWRGWLGRLLVVRVGPSSWLGGLLLFFLFYFSVLFHLFEFKFGLEFEFKSEVTCSLEFREFCLIISLWNC